MEKQKQDYYADEILELRAWEGDFGIEEGEL